MRLWRMALRTRIHFHMSCYSGAGCEMPSNRVLAETLRCWGAEGNLAHWLTKWDRSFSQSLCQSILTGEIGPGRGG